MSYPLAAVLEVNEALQLMLTIATRVSTCVNYLQTCLYQSSVGTDCVTTTSEALFG